MMYLQHIKNIVALVILVTAIAGNSMTIPIVKGNTWSYSYLIDTNANPYFYYASYTGFLRYSVDSVKVIVDTTLFTLSYFDSGFFHLFSRIWQPDSQKYDSTDTIRPYVLKYQKSYRLSGDLIIKRDTISSPGYNGSLLSFTKQSDSSYSWGAPNNGGDYTRKTDSFTINVLNLPLTLVHITIDNNYRFIPNMHIFSGSNNDSAFSWVPEIGMVFFYSEPAPLK